MVNYVAFVKPRGQSKPMKLLFKAANVVFGLMEMFKLAGVKGTEDVDEYELLEVVGDDKYRVVAEKLGNKSKPHVSLPAAVPPTIIPDNVNEREYAGYEVEAM